ncbi:MAG: endonuclease/exonuclease/phosphatase family protein [Actinomycetota bacterium]
MASPPTTRPETWVPAGAEREGAIAAPPNQAQPASGQLVRRRPNVPLPTPEGRRQPRPSGRLLGFLGTLGWTTLSAITPWAWFLVRDLGPPVQLVALALPAVVVATILGLAIAAIDERKITPLIVAASVAAFGWVTIFGPRGPQPSPPPVDPVRIATIALPDSGDGVVATLAAVGQAKADVTIVVEPSKKARSTLLHADRSRFTLASGRFVVLSSAPVRELALPDSLPDDLILRLEVDRPGGAFILYAVRANDSVLGTTLNDPLLIDRLTKAALAEPLPVVLAGDFGISDRSSEYRALAETFRDALRSGAGAETTARTFPWSFLFLRTDYVLTSPSWCAAGGGTFDVQGADHHGVTTSVGPCKR